MTTGIIRPLPSAACTRSALEGTKYGRPWRSNHCSASRMEAARSVASGMPVRLAVGHRRAGQVAQPTRRASTESGRRGRASRRQVPRPTGRRAAGGRRRCRPRAAGTAVSSALRPVARLATATRTMCERARAKSLPPLHGRATKCWAHVVACGQNASPDSISGISSAVRGSSIASSSASQRSSPTASAFCWSNGASVDGHRRRADRDRHVDERVVAVDADDVTDQPHDALPPGVGQVVVDAPRHRRQQRMRAGRVVGEPFTGQPRGELHEARAAARVAMLPAREHRDALWKRRTTWHSHHPDREQVAPVCARSARDTTLRPGFVVRDRQPRGTSGGVVSRARARSTSSAICTSSSSTESNLTIPRSRSVKATSTITPYSSRSSRSST